MSGSTPSSVTINSRWGKNRTKLPSLNRKYKYRLSAYYAKSCISRLDNYIYLKLSKSSGNIQCVLIILQTCEVFLNIRLYRKLGEDIESLLCDNCSSDLAIVPSFTFNLSPSDIHLFPSGSLPEKIRFESVLYFS